MNRTLKNCKKNMLQNAVEFVADSKAKTLSLKERSEYYPKVLIEQENDEQLDRDGYRGLIFVASTLVRKEHKKKWYTIHHVVRWACDISDQIRAKEMAKGHLLEKMMFDVHNSLNFYKISGKYEDLDTLQQSEPDRLRIIFTDVHPGIYISKQ